MDFFCTKIRLAVLCMKFSKKKLEDKKCWQNCAYYDGEIDSRLKNEKGYSNLDKMFDTECRYNVERKET